MTERTDLVPKRRFKEFQNTQAWGQRHLKDVVNVCSGRDYKHLSDGDIPVYGTGGYMLSVSEALSYDEDAIGIGRKGTIDKPYLLRAPFWTVDTLFYAIPRKYYDLDFVHSVFQRVDWKQRDESTGVPSLSKVAINSVKVLVPTYEEQQKIGTFFQNLDHLITLHQRKLEKTKALKSAYLSEMFPDEGEREPKRRFAGFTQAWKQWKVKDAFKVTRGYVLAAPETSSKKTDEKPYPVYSSQTKDNGLMGYYKDYLYDTAITWTTDGANAGTVNFRDGRFYCTNVCGVLLSDEGLANKMVAEALNKIAWKHVSKVGNPKLMNNVMSEINISLPQDMAEQTQISELFTQLDNLITLHQRKLEKLQNIKKAYLNEMFI